MRTSPSSLVEPPNPGRWSCLRWVRSGSRCGGVRRGLVGSVLFGTLPLEFLHFGLTAKYQLTTALARLRERGDREAVGEGFADWARRKQPLTPGFAVPSPRRGPLSTAAPL